MIYVTTSKKEIKLQKLDINLIFRRLKKSKHNNFVMGYSLIGKSSSF